MNVVTKSLLLVLMTTVSCLAFNSRKSLNLECDRTSGSSRIQKTNIKIEAGQVWAYMQYNAFSHLPEPRTIKMTYRIQKLEPNPTYSLAPASLEEGNDYATVHYNEDTRAGSVEIYNSMTWGGARVYLTCKDSNKVWPKRL